MDLFSVRAEPTAIDQTNPTGLAGAYARFLVEKHAAGGHFARLFTQGYRVILQRYYVSSIAAAAKVEGEGSELRCEVGPVRLDGREKAIAELKHTWRAAKAAHRGGQGLCGPRRGHTAAGPGAEDSRSRPARPRGTEVGGTLP
jgi:hypothetical protein